MISDIVWLAGTGVVTSLGSEVEGYRRYKSGVTRLGRGQLVLKRPELRTLKPVDVIAASVSLLYVSNGVMNVVSGGMPVILPSIYALERVRY